MMFSPENSKNSGRCRHLVQWPSPALDFAALHRLFFALVDPCLQQITQSSHAR
jgi:hypothetical protein